MVFNKEKGRFEKIVKASIDGKKDEVVPTYTFRSPELISSDSQLSYVKEENESVDDEICNDVIREIVYPDENPWDHLAEG